MIKTLHAYIARELAKAALLALVAFTLVMTVFAIIEPLRKEGLATAQVAELFLHTLPVTLSFTLPVAALFAATIVYGRFAQDNELLACRASGLPTFTVLKPAMVLAALVTLATLTLSNYVAPVMAERAGRLVKSDFRGIVYNQLRTRNYIDGRISENDKGVIYVDGISRLDDQSDLLRGVVGVQIKDGKSSFMVATVARLTSYVDEDETYAIIELGETTGSQSGFDKTKKGSPSQIADMVNAEQAQFPPILVPNPVEQKTAWYTWGGITSVLRNPVRNPSVARGLNRFRRTISGVVFCDSLASRINAPADRGGGMYTFSSPRGVYSLRAASATLESDGKGVRLAGDAGQKVTISYPEVDPQNGQVSIYVVSARSGRVRAKNDSGTREAVLQVELEGDLILHAGQSGSIGQPAKWSRTFPTPQTIKEQVDRIGLDSLQDHVPVNDAKMAGQVREFLDRTVPSAINTLVAELHSRVAYAASCFLLVVLGAALGLIFRGGQLVSAFAISIAPAAAVIVLIIMGKQLATHPKLPLIAGLSVIWGGVVALLAACVVIYAHLARK